MEVIGAVKVKICYACLIKFPVYMVYDLLMDILCTTCGKKVTIQILHIDKGRYNIYLGNTDLVAGIL